ncbi:MAG: hypothetical protein HYZ57_11015 [Acidobacteria bacterium]|nr:hypothetical protein [Acidobacteriota bacterium]MBI3280359.1 hypothetical protein [Acidobacteriota bacterium]
MTSRVRPGLVVAAFALLSVLAVFGWMRKPDAGRMGAGAFTPTAAYNAPGAYNPYGQPVMYDAQGRPVYGQAPYGYAGFNPCAAPPLGYSSAAYVPAEGYGYAAPAVRTVRSQPRVIRTRYVADRDSTVRRKRSTGKSVAIVAGSAGAGAAIGALAGGGKGAAIGAVSGGVAGLVYDRLTHNR